MRLQAEDRDLVHAVVSKLHSRLTGPDRAFLYRMARTTGLRKSELDSLTPRSFRFDAPAWLIVEAVYSKHREADTVFLHPDVATVIQIRISSLEPHQPHFPRLSQRKTAGMMQADLAAGGISYQDDSGRFADFHALRHTFVTKAWETNAPANVIMNLARHKVIATTMRYTHKDQAAQIKAVNAMTPSRKLSG